MATQEEEICCPEFKPETYDEKTQTWENKLFIRDYVTLIFHMPLNMGSVIKRMDKMVREAGAEVPVKDFLLLAYDPSQWKSELYMSVAKPVEGAENVKLSGNFVSKVFDGPYNAVPQWIAEFESYLKSQNKKALKYYFYYTTCPKCAKKYGHNYVVAFAEV